MRRALSRLLSNRANQLCLSRPKGKRYAASHPVLNPRVERPPIVSTINFMMDTMTADKN